ncbi:helix-turn-helix domain-containing protein [Aquabacterium sp.]|uniref:helix-turn-helix domain-containing protein n=1 Tax=Aquabacterium sp. TaxID=1872578 RepID=UPI00199C60A3|nr:helix-turn-helix domain-containing protein [Aquabacterium sp.]MBC7698836.1 response regulator [Aquabacterium sp.]
MTAPEPHDPPLLSEEARDPSSALAAECLSALMERHGVPARQQAAALAQITTISISQARRKLRGAVWLFGEVLAVTQHFGESLDQVFASPALTSPAPIATQAAQFLVDGQALPCEVRLGAQIKAWAPPTVVLAAAHDAQGWWVASPAALHARGLQGPHYLVAQVSMTQDSQAKPTRIAVVDDDLASAEALGDWFNETGYRADSFTSAAQLLGTPLADYDAFVVDLILGVGQTSHALVEQIRAARPQAPIVLLTGQLRGGVATEADLTTLLRTQGVAFFEKPVRPAVLTATIQSKLDRLANNTPA